MSVIKWYLILGVISFVFINIHDWYYKAERSGSYAWYEYVFMVGYIVVVWPIFIPNYLKWFHGDE